MADFDPALGPYCEYCGAPGDDHAACLRALELEPPRYCRICGRRMVVQVLPAGWRATCSRHGTASVIKE